MTGPTDAPEPVPLLHVGLHKTGSTWIQRRYFARPESGFHDVASALGRRTLLDATVRVDPFRDTSDQVSAALQPELDHARTTGRVPVISHERLSGYPASGFHDRRAIAERLARALPGARVLMVVREQRALLYSTYGQYVADGGPLSLRALLEPRDRRVGRAPGFDLRGYDFDVTATLYQELFGESSVLVVAQEALHADAAATLARIAAFAGVEPWVPGPAPADNTRRPYAMQDLRRLANATIARSEFSPTGTIDSAKVGAALMRVRPAFEALAVRPVEERRRTRDTAFIERVVGDRFARSNRALDARLDVGLAPYGYWDSPASR